MVLSNQSSDKLLQMKRFYELFPYPNRPFFFMPCVSRQLYAHGAFGTWVSQGQTKQAEELYSFCQEPKIAAKLHKQYRVADLANNFPHSKRILLVGCGTDEPLLFRKLHPRNEIVCIDLSKKNIFIAKQKLRVNILLNLFKLRFSQLKSAQFIQGDANLILAQNFMGKFDYIQCFGVLHHQPQPEILVEKLAKTLSQTGFLRIMVYSFHGRRLERKIQKRYQSLWDNEIDNPSFKIKLFSQFIKLKMWQMLNFFGIKKSTSQRFKYLGLNSNLIADALLHPSDPGLDLNDLAEMAKKNKLQLKYCHGKIETHGIVHGFEDAQQAWKNIVSFDVQQQLVSNPILIFNKVSL